VFSLMAGVRVTVTTIWDENQIRGLREDPGVVAYVRDVGEGFARAERFLAPKRTGAGAGSIQVRPSRSKGAVDVGWDREHRYMGYQELGTKYIARKNFAGLTVAQYLHT
jgi:hypothetical protein